MNACRIAVRSRRYLLLALQPNLMAWRRRTLAEPPEVSALDALLLRAPDDLDLLCGQATATLREDPDQAALSGLLAGLPDEHKLAILHALPEEGRRAVGGHPGWAATVGRAPHDEIVQALLLLHDLAGTEYADPVQALAREVLDPYEAHRFGHFSAALLDRKLTGDPTNNWPHRLNAEEEAFAAVGEEAAAWLAAAASENGN
jgi:hypothetical protein